MVHSILFLCNTQCIQIIHIYTSYSYAYMPCSYIHTSMAPWQYYFHSSYSSFPFISTLFFSITISLITLSVSETCRGPQPTFYLCSMLLISYHAISMICKCITYYHCSLLCLPSIPFPSACNGLTSHILIQWLISFQIVNCPLLTSSLTSLDY